jgi:hypothetical protein
MVDWNKPDVKELFELIKTTIDNYHLGTLRVSETFPNPPDCRIVSWEKQRDTAYARCKAYFQYQFLAVIETICEVLGMAHIDEVFHVSDNWPFVMEVSKLHDLLWPVIVMPHTIYSSSHVGWSSSNML